MSEPITITVAVDGAEIAKTVANQPRPSSTGWLDARLSCHSRSVLELALRVALTDGSNYIKPRHLQSALDRFNDEV